MQLFAIDENSEKFKLNEFNGKIENSRESLKSSREKLLLSQSVAAIETLLHQYQSRLLFFIQRSLLYVNAIEDLDYFHCATQFLRIFRIGAEVFENFRNLPCPINE